MSKKTRSARGDMVDFDLLAIKQQLAVTPTPVSVEARRRFIDEKDGVKTKSIPIVPATPAALSIAAEAARESETAAKTSKTKNVDTAKADTKE